MLRLRATASIARTCRRSLLQQHQNSRSLFSASALSSSKLDKLLPQVEDFPSRHIGPRRHDAKDMLRVLGYNVGIHAYNGILFDGYLSHVRVHATYSNIFCSLWTNSRTLPFLPTSSWTGLCTWRIHTVSSILLLITVLGADDGV